MKVYVAYRYSAKDVLSVLSNIGKAVDVGHELAQIEGVYPFVPHLDCLVAMRSPPLPLSYYYNCSMEYLNVCNAIYIVDVKDLDTSKGVLAEYEYAKKAGMKVFYCIGDVLHALGRLY